ncbi:MAG: cyclic nucleotide-binding domain-containing protein [Candidatus Binatia bacterium]
MILVVHRPGEFIGEVGQLTGAPCLLSGIARGDCEVYEVSSNAYLRLLDHSNAR